MEFEESSAVEVWCSESGDQCGKVSEAWTRGTARVFVDSHPHLHVDSPSMSSLRLWVTRALPNGILNLVLPMLLQCWSNITVCHSDRSLAHELFKACQGHTLQPKEKQSKAK